MSNTYTYTYDKLNRLLSGTGSTGYTESNITYDVMGNLTQLYRYVPTSTLNDNLAYSYAKSGNPTNQLQSVVNTGASSANIGIGTTSYTYDGNGNLLSTANTVNTGKNKSFTYNGLSQLKVATFPSGTATFAYDFTGNKLRKVDALTSGVTTYTDYIGGIQYDGSNTAAETISFVQTDEGKAVPLAGGKFDYNYYLGDNLGNTRVTFHTDSGAASPTQKDNYYPFGLEINLATIAPKNEYLYNKKELQEEFGEYDYGARFYDPVIGRWTAVDPLAEKYKAHSTYNYGLNNPIRNIDMNGDSIRTNGSQSATASMKQTMMASIGGNGTFTQDANGTWSVSQTDDQQLNMTDVEAENYKTLSNMMSAKGVANFDLVDEKDDLSRSVLIGDNGASEESPIKGVHVIDMGDIKQFGNNGALTSAGALYHELKEGFDYQTKPDKPGQLDADKVNLAHQAGINAENVVDSAHGAARTDSRQQRVNFTGGTLYIPIVVSSNGTLQLRTVTIKVKDNNFKSSDIQNNGLN